MDISQHYLHILAEEQAAAQVAFVGSGTGVDRDSLCALVAARMTALRWRQRFQRLSIESQLLQPVFPGLLSAIPSSGWVHLSASPAFNMELAVDCALLAKLNGACTERLQISLSTPTWQILSINASPWVHTSQGSLELTLCSNIEQNPAVIPLFLWENNSVHWELWQRLRRASRVFLTWDGSCGDGRWTGPVSEFLVSDPLIPVGSLTQLRTALLDLDGECRINLRLPTTCRGWTTLVCRMDYDVLQEDFPSMTSVPLLNCFRVHDLQVQAVPFDLGMEEAELNLACTSDRACSVLSVQAWRDARLIPLAVSSVFTLRSEPCASAPMRTWLCGLPFMDRSARGRGIAQLEVCGGTRTAGWWKAAQTFEMHSKGCDARFKGIRPIIPHTPARDGEEWLPCVSQLLRMLTSGGDDWSVWKAFLEGLSRHCIDASHPMRRVIQIQWKDRCTMLEVKVKPWEGDSRERVIQDARMSAFLQALRRFLGGILPFWFGDFEVTIVNP